jgi:hypothetical protein
VDAKQTDASNITLMLVFNTHSHRIERGTRHHNQPHAELRRYEQSVFDRDSKSQAEANAHKLVNLPTLLDVVRSAADFCSILCVLGSEAAPGRNGYHRTPGRERGRAMSYPKSGPF